MRRIFGKPRSWHTIKIVRSSSLSSSFTGSLEKKPARLRILLAVGKALAASQTGKVTVGPAKRIYTHDHPWGVRGDHMPSLVEIH